MTLLTIIIPAYNAEPYINELLDRLAPQITPDVETIIVDDGSKKPFQTSYKWANVIRQENGGASAARNTGLDNAHSKYIAFIDADDLIADNYIETVLNKIKAEKPDYIYLSWKAFGGWNIQVKLKSIEDQFPPFNCCVWNRIYKRSMIGKVRFNTLKACAEDAQFIRDVKEEGKKKAFIGEYMYFYRSNTVDSLTKRAGAGKIDTKRIVYHFPEVTKDMDYLIQEFKDLDYDTEVILLTNKNEIPELNNYAMVLCPPQNVSGPELRGVPTPFFHKIHKPLKTQILVYVSNLKAIGGIETWTYNFCRYLCDFYDIMVLCDKEPDIKQKRRLLPIAQVVINDNKPIICDTAINCRVALVLPKNVQYKHKYQIVHTLKMQPSWNLAETADKMFFVSEASRRSYGIDGEIIPNMTLNSPIYKKPLLFVSATRLSWEKGGNRIHKLASMMDKLGILFTWLIFTDDQPTDYIDGLVYRKPTFDVRSYIQQANFYISLSDQEAFGYSIVEALELGTPVITTPIDVLPEIGFEEGLNGYTIPFNISQLSSNRLLEILGSNLKGFRYHYDNEPIVEQWRDILGRDIVPTRRYKPKEGFKFVVALKDYKDVPLQRSVRTNEVLEVPEKIAIEGAKQGFYEIIT